MMRVKKLSGFIIVILLFMGNSRTLANKRKQTVATDTTINESVYKVARLKTPIKIDGNWNKEQWQHVEPVMLQRHMGQVPPFVPVVEAKMMYDNQNIYVIFRVQDKFVQSTVTKYNGPVSENSCVEFFFSPDTMYPMHYFNLEVNAGGTPLIFYITKPWSGYKELEPDNIKKIEIAHSLPSVVDPEMQDPVTWTIEYRIPLDMLKQYADVTQPASGIKWKGNFYKTGSKTSNPNYMTWSFVDNEKPNFHLPQFFGTLIFQ
jgi:hypothetical protein